MTLKSLGAGIKANTIAPVAKKMSSVFSAHPKGAGMSIFEKTLAARDQSAWLFCCTAVRAFAELRFHAFFEKALEADFGDAWGCRALLHIGMHSVFQGLYAVASRHCPRALIGRTKPTLHDRYLKSWLILDTEHAKGKVAHCLTRVGGDEVPGIVRPH